MMTIGLLHLGNLDPEGMSALDVSDPGHVVTRGRGDVEGANHPMKGGDLVQIKERKHIGLPKIGGGEMIFLHHHSKKKAGRRVVNHKQAKGNRRHNHSNLSR